MNYTINNKASARLKKIEGQIRGLQRMLEEGKYCVDIINQSLAAKSALSAVEDLILENHLATHVAKQMRSGSEEKAVKEVLNIYKLSKRK